MNCAAEWVRGHIAEGRTVVTISVDVAYQAAIIASGLVPDAIYEPPPPWRLDHIVVTDADGVEWAAVLSL